MSNRRTADRCPRRVLHVLSGPSGGAAISTISLMRALAKRGVGSSAVCHDSGREDERRRLQEAVEGRLVWTDLYWWNRKTRAAPWKRPLLEVRQGLRTGWSILSSRAVLSAAKDWCPDLIHSNTLLTREGAWAAHRLSLPHVWHVREFVGTDAPFQFPLSGRALARYLGSMSSLLVANSEVAAEALRAYAGGELEVRVVTNGVDVDTFAHIDLSTRSPVVVGMVGNLSSRWKKHQLFIETAALVPREPEATFRLYGDAPPNPRDARDPYVRQLVESIDALSVNDRFEIVGFRSDPVSIMEEVDVLVHPADGESFGRVVVEAMAAGKPVVGVRGGGVGSIVRHGIDGFLAAPGAAEEMAYFVATLVQDASLRRKMGAEGRRRAREEYSIESMCDRMCRVYSEALARTLRRSD